MPTQTLTRPATKSRRIDLEPVQAEALSRLLRRVGARGAVTTLGETQPDVATIRVTDRDFAILSMVLFRLTPKGDADAA